MPLYLYECNTCGERFEMVRKVSERDEEVECTCGGECERMVSQKTSFDLKGSGWSRDNYAMHS